MYICLLRIESARVNERSERWKSFAQNSASESAHRSRAATWVVHVKHSSDIEVIAVGIHESPNLIHIHQRIDFVLQLICFFLVGIQTNILCPKVRKKGSNIVLMISPQVEICGEPVVHILLATSTSWAGRREKRIFARTSNNWLAIDLKGSAFSGTTPFGTRLWISVIRYLFWVL